MSREIIFCRSITINTNKKYKYVYGESNRDHAGRSESMANQSSRNQSLWIGTEEHRRNYESWEEGGSTKISEIRIDGRVMTKTGRIGRVTGALDTGRIYVLFGSDEYPSRMFAGELEPVSDSCHFAKGDKVRATGKSIYGANIEGKTFEVVDPDYHSAEHATWSAWMVAI